MNKAFTLVELLVVIAVIVLLVTMISPAVLRARELGRQTVCLSNHSNIVKAVFAYSTDNQSFPYNYGWYYEGPQRWALGYLNPYLSGGKDRRTELRLADDPDAVQPAFPGVYVCPSADLPKLHRAQPRDIYHACYWTNIAIRGNRGWTYLFNTQGAPVGQDADADGVAKIYGRYCPDPPFSHWRTVYQPNFRSLGLPAQAIFTGDTSDEPFASSYATPAGTWQIGPGEARVHGSLGFGRHLNKLLVGYMDGRATVIPRDALQDNYSCWPGTTELTGDFLIDFPESKSCRGSREHNLPARQGNRE